MDTLLVVVILVGLAVLIALGVVAWLLMRSQQQTTPPTPRSGTVARRQDPFADTDSTAGDPRALKVGDMVEYLDRRFFVRGSLRLREGGFTWSEHFLDDVEGTKRWVSVEEDPDLEVVMWTEYEPADGSRLTPDAPVLTVEGVEYRRDEHGTATYDGEGSTGVGTSGKVEYVDYEGPGGRALAFERFAGGAWECGVGERVPTGTLTIYPSTDSLR